MVPATRHVCEHPMPTLPLGHHDTALVAARTDRQLSRGGMSVDVVAVNHLDLACLVPTGSDLDKTAHTIQHTYRGVIAASDRGEHHSDLGCLNSPVDERPHRFGCVPA